MDAVFISKMSVASKWQIPQIIKQFFVCPGRELVEDYFQVFVLPAGNGHGDSIALLRSSLSVEPVSRGKLYGCAFQARVGNFPMLLRWHLVLHRRVCDFGDRQFAT